MDQFTQQLLQPRSAFARLHEWLVRPAPKAARLAPRRVNVASIGSGFADPRSRGFKRIVVTSDEVSP